MPMNADGGQVVEDGSVDPRNTRTSQLETAPVAPEVTVEAASLERGADPFHSCLSVSPCRSYRRMTIIMTEDMEHTRNRCSPSVVTLTLVSRKGQTQVLHVLGDDSMVNTMSH